MSNHTGFQQEVFEIIQSVRGEKNLLAIPRLFLEATGDLETGTFLAQLVYWSDKGARPDGYIYKTLDEWSREIFLSEYALRKARRKLEEWGLLQTMVKKANGNPTLHYKLLRKPLIDWLLHFRGNQPLKTRQGNFENEVSLTETTTENTNKKQNPEVPLPGIYLIDSKEVNMDDVAVRASYTKEWFFKKYQATFHCEHPDLTPRQWQCYREALESFFQEFNVWPEEIDGLINLYFTTDDAIAYRKMGLDCQFTHFCNSEALRDLFYQAGYGE